MSNQPFVWHGAPLPTVGDLLDAVCALASLDEAAEFMSGYRAVNDHADANIGYIVGYVEPRERRAAIYNLLQLEHPVFGGTP